MACDVFEKDPFGCAFPDNPGDFGPEVPRITGPAALSGGAERLAGISGEDDVERPAERPRIKSSQIIPDRRWRKIPGALGTDEDGAGICLPLDKCAGVISGLGQHEAQIKASAACAEGQSVPGT